MSEDERDDFFDSFMIGTPFSNYISCPFCDHCFDPSYAEYKKVGVYRCPYCGKEISQSKIDPERG